LKIICFGYRQWSLNIYREISKNSNHKFIIFKNKKDLIQKNINKINPDIILFYGWSWFVPNKIINKYKCLMLHPSKLPKFRGGSPIQNQIIRGYKITYVTIFRMNQHLDSGNILLSEKISLEGEMKDILKRIEQSGIKLTFKILNKKIKEKPQDHSKATYYNRLVNNSEITMKELKNSDSIYLYDKIRMLGDPYPNAYIKTSDGKKLLIKTVKIKLS